MLRNPARVISPWKPIRTIINEQDGTDITRADLPGSLHSLRHTYICHLLLALVPIRTVQLHAGHASIATTEKYAYQVLRQDPEAALRLAI